MTPFSSPQGFEESLSLRMTLMRTASANSVEIVKRVWELVLVQKRFSALSGFVTEDFEARSSNKEALPRELLQYGLAILREFDNLHLAISDIFENEDGTRVLGHWKLSGSCQVPGCPGSSTERISFAGLIIFAIHDGKLRSVWVERVAWDFFHRLTARCPLPSLEARQHSPAQNH